jgi:hypothetical protein
VLSVSSNDGASANRHFPALYRNHECETSVGLRESSLVISVHPQSALDAAPERLDPLALDRTPQACKFDLQEGQTGISYRRLFGPYLHVARIIYLSGSLHPARLSDS